MLNIHSAYSKLKRSYFKNLPHLIALRYRLYPEFVFARHPKTVKDEIPVFTFHSVEPDGFEEQLRFLSKNGYQTLTADEFYECLVGSKPIPEKTILLTFDDGWKSVATVAYPLLKRYSMRAVCFLIPGLIQDGEKSQSNLSGINSGKSYDVSSDPLCNWHEIKEIHQSGVIDFESHSMSHHLIFTSSHVEDFFYPYYDSYLKNLNVLFFRINGEENINRHAELGMPIYEHASRFSGKRRYFDDENLRNHCIEYVRLNGGEDFFKKYDWRKKLIRLIENYRRKHSDSGYFESEDDIRENLYNNFLESKLAIERKLPGKTVNHFCYPWWEGSDIAVDMSKKVGYLTNFWGVLPGRRTNRRGDDPFRIVRLVSDEYIFRLPGEGRKSLSKIIAEKFSTYYKGLFNRLVKPDNGFNT